MKFYSFLPQVSSFHHVSCVLPSVSFFRVFKEQKAIFKSNEITIFFTSTVKIIDFL